MNTRHYPITIEMFKQEIEPYIIAYKNRLGRPSKVNHYEFFCAVLYVLRTGVSWRDLPSFYGNWHTIYTRFKRWSESGLFWYLLYNLQQKKRVSLDIVWVDSSTIGLHRHGAGPLKKTGLNLQARKKGVKHKDTHWAFFRRSAQECVLVWGTKSRYESFSNTLGTRQLGRNLLCA